MLTYTHKTRLHTQTDSQKYTLITPNKCTHKYTHAYTPTDTHTCMHARTHQAYTHVRLHTKFPGMNIHKCAVTYIRILTHAHIHNTRNTHKHDHA